MFDDSDIVLEHPHLPGKMRWIWSLQIAEASDLPGGLWAEPQPWPVKKPLLRAGRLKQKVNM